jgi:hypothetical protein
LTSDRDPKPADKPKETPAPLKPHSQSVLTIYNDVLGVPDTLSSTIEQSRRLLAGFIVKDLASEIIAGPPEDQRADLVGQKAATLAKLRALTYPVPPFAVLSSEAYRTSILADDELAARKTEFDRRLVSKFDLMGAAENVRAKLAGLKMEEESIEAINAMLSDLGIAAPFAVRSSAVFEDLSRRSFAGAYESVLDVEPERLAAAITRCWASLFSMKAVFSLSDASEDLHRAGSDLSHHAMAVILQQMVETELYGVCFTSDPLTQNAAVVVIEAAGHPGALVSGEGPALRAVFDKASGRRLTLEAPEGELASLKSAFETACLMIVKLATDAERDLGGPQDLEWAANADEAWLLQARPIVARPRIAKPLGETRIVAAEQDPEGKTLDYGDCGGLRATYERKKFAFRRTANERGVPLPAWYWMEWSRESIEKGEDPGGLFESDYVWMDLSSNLRALQVHRSDLRSYMAKLAEHHPAGRLTALIRESWDVELGAVSVLLPDDTVMIEYCSGILKGILNGIAEPSHLWIGPDGAERAADIAEQSVALVIDPVKNEVVEKTLEPPLRSRMPEPAAREINRGTRALSEVITGVRPEWWVVGKRAMVFDVSVETEGGRMGEASVLSAGSAEGAIVRIDDLSPFDGLGEGWAVSVVGFDERMLELDGIRNVVERLRDAKAKGPVILAAPRPHVGLIALLDYVDGCIFGFATMLSHLAIVLRERHIPAIADAAFVKTAVEGSHVAFDESGVQ